MDGSSSTLRYQRGSAEAALGYFALPPLPPLPRSSRPPLSSPIPWDTPIPGHYVSSEHDGLVSVMPNSDHMPPGSSQMTWSDYEGVRTEAETHLQACGPFRERYFGAQDTLSDLARRCPEMPNATRVRQLRETFFNTVQSLRMSLDGLDRTLKALLRQSEGYLLRNHARDRCANYWTRVESDLEVLEETRQAQKNW